MYVCVFYNHWWFYKVCICVRAFVCKGDSFDSFGSWVRASLQRCQIYENPAKQGSKIAKETSILSFPLLYYVYLIKFYRFFCVYVSLWIIKGDCNMLSTIWQRWSGLQIVKLTILQLSLLIGLCLKIISSIKLI